MIELAANRYGKAAIRIVRVGRQSNPHVLRDLTVAVALEGDFTAAHTDGDNTNVVATDTMKNTAYAFALDHLHGSIEHYATSLARHFLEAPQVERATVNVRFAKDGDVVTMRSQAQQGTWTIERPLASGTYAYELWAVDAMGNRSATHPGEVRVRG